LDTCPVLQLAAHADKTSANFRERCRIDQNPFVAITKAGTGPATRTEKTMSTTATATVTTTTTTTRRFPLLKAGAAAGAAAAVVTTLIAAATHAAGVSFADKTGESIPTSAFAQLTFMGALLGVALAAGVRRRASQPRRTFTRVAWTLAVVSCVAPTLIGLEAAAVAVLVVEHLVAASVVIPWIASRMPR
jgi:hypothetical protein